MIQTYSLIRDFKIMMKIFIKDAKPVNGLMTLLWHCVWQIHFCEIIFNLMALILDIVICYGGILDIIMVLLTRLHMG